MTYEQTEIKDRLIWLVRLRWAGCIGVLVATHIVREIAGLTFPLIPVYIILAFTGMYNTYFHFRLNKPIDNYQRIAIEQISLDFLVLTAAVYFSGGCDSPFLYYFIFHVVISGILLPRIWTFRFAVIAIALPTSIVGLKHFGILPHFTIFRDEPQVFSNLIVIAAYGGVFASTLLFTAYFVTYLSDKLFKKQEEIRRLYIMSERLRSSIITKDVISTIKSELSVLIGNKKIVYMPMNKSKLTLIYCPVSDTDPDACDAVSDSLLSTSLLDKNALTETFLSCEARVIESGVLVSGNEAMVFEKIMPGAKRLLILPVRAAFTTKCFDLFNCPSGTGCPAYGSEDRRCWYIAGTFCHGKVMRSITDKLKECSDCDMFAPVGIFIIDITKKSRLDTEIDIEACMRLIDAASLAVSNARLYEKTVELSETDGLTGMKNKKTFMRLLDSEISRAKRYGKTFGLMMLDIDHFKVYNDTNGHPQGDVLLRMMVDTIKSALRDTDVEGRYGGEEFIVMFPETAKEETALIAERIRSSVEEFNFPRAESQPEGRITVSIGVSSYPDDGDTVEKIIRAADDALYVAKVTGRNRVIEANRPESLI